MEKQREEEQLKERRASQAIESGKEVMIEVENLQMEPAAPSTSRNNVVQRVLSSVLSSIHSGVQSIMEPVQVEEEELKVKSPLHPLVPLGAPKKNVQVCCHNGLHREERQSNIVEEALPNTAAGSLLEPDDSALSLDISRFLPSLTDRLLQKEESVLIHSAEIARTPYEVFADAIDLFSNKIVNNITDNLSAHVLVSVVLSAEVLAALAQWAASSSTAVPETEGTTNLKKCKKCTSDEEVQEPILPSQDGKNQHLQKGGANSERKGRNLGGSEQLIPS
ncbi:hypothetical protein AOLI_G00266160 [Acnodon oligacanthus]